MHGLFGGIKLEFNENNIKKALAIPLLEKIGTLVERRAKELCPVDTGLLRSSITHRVIPEELSVIIGTNIWYAPYVEFLYDINNPHPGRETGQMPFLRVALFQSKPAIVKIIEEGLGK